jgi:hypothetical protein
MLEDTESFNTNIAPSTPSTIPVHWPTSKGDMFLSPSEYLIVVWQELSRPFPSNAMALPLARVPTRATVPIHVFIANPLSVMLGAYRLCWPCATTRLGLLTSDEIGL